MTTPRMVICKPLARSIWVLMCCLVAIEFQTLYANPNQEEHSAASSLFPRDSPWKGVSTSIVERIGISADSTGKSARKPLSKRTLYTEMVNFQHPSAQNDSRRFKSPTLGYVTPWNGLGYDVAKAFCSKFDMISPVWLQLEPMGTGVKGMHDVDKEWVKSLRACGSKVVPRLLFDGWNQQAISAFLSMPAVQQESLDKILKVVSDYGFDGVVIEYFMSAGGLSVQRREDTWRMLSLMGSSLKRQGLSAILVVPPIRPSSQVQIFDSVDFKALAAHFDFFQVMTYDYSVGQGKAGPNSPIDWCRANARAMIPNDSLASKLLLGINMYGYRFSKERGAEAVLWNEFRSSLAPAKRDHSGNKRATKLKFNKSAQEHYVQETELAASGEHVPSSVLWFPTPQSMHARLQLAEEIGCGVALWEIGQGYLALYDLL